MKKAAEKENLRSKINCWRKISNKKGVNVTKTEPRVSWAERWRHTSFSPSSEIKEWGAGRRKENFWKTMIHGTEKLMLLVVHGVGFFWKAGSIVSVSGSGDRDLCTEANLTYHSPSTNPVHWRSKPIRPLSWCFGERILEWPDFLALLEVYKVSYKVTRANTLAILKLNQF